MQCDCREMLARRGGTSVGMSTALLTNGGQGWGPQGPDGCPAGTQRGDNRTMGGDMREELAAAHHLHTRGIGGPCGPQHPNEPNTPKPWLANKCPQPNWPTPPAPHSPATCAAACDVPLCAVKHVLQSLEAPMMSSPGANRSTQRPKLVPRVPMEAGWSSLLVAPTAMTCRGGDRGGCRLAAHPHVSTRLGEPTQPLPLAQMLASTGRHHPCSYRRPRPSPPPSAPAGGSRRSARGCRHRRRAAAPPAARRAEPPASS